MSDFLWTLFFLLALAFALAPHEFNYTIDGVKHHIAWSTESNVQPTNEFLHED